MHSIQVHVGYERPRAYALTPSCKHIVKAVARKSKQAVAMECMKDSVTRKHVLRRVGMVMRSELITMCQTLATLSSAASLHLRYAASLGRNC